MHHLEESLEGGDERAWFESVYAEGLVGPVDLARFRVPLPTTEVRHALRLGQALLALPELLLGLLALGDVEEDSLPVQGLPLLILYEDGLLAHPHYGPVLGEETVLLAERLSANLQTVVGGQDPLTVVGVEARLPQLVRPPLLLGVAEHLLYLGARVHGFERAVGAVYVDHGGDLLDEGAVEFLRLPERLLGPHAF